MQLCVVAFWVWRRPALGRRLAGMVIQGHDTTVPVTLDEMIYHTRAVSRGSSTAHVVGDLPFMSYRVSENKR